MDWTDKEMRENQLSENYKMLVITKDEQAFQQGTPLLLLGKWCNADDAADSNIPDINYVYNPLSDNNEREKHYHYIQKTSSRLLVKMANVLNTYHKRMTA